MEQIGRAVGLLAIGSSSPTTKAAHDLIPVITPDRLPLLFVREVDRDIPDRVVMFWEGAGENLGAPVLRGPLTDDERKSLTRRSYELRCALAPWPETSRKVLLDAIQGMLGSFPSMQRYDRLTAAGMAASYRETACKRPHWAVIQACALIRSGKLADVSKDFPPSEGKFNGVIGDCIEAYEKRLAANEQVLAAKVDAPPLQRPTQAEIEAKLGRPIHGRPPSGLLAPITPPPGDGKHAARVAADLAARRARLQQNAGFSDQESAP